MDIINPNEIGGKISTLIAEAKEIFYVSTYNIDLVNWRKVLINFENAIKRGVSIKIYFRWISEPDLKVLRSLGIELYQIRHLHTKLYFNEKEAIVSSMNFYEYSDLHSIEIGLHYNTPENYKKLYDYFQRYISSKASGTISFEGGHTKKSNLDNLLITISSNFSDTKINSRQTYLFSEDLIPTFHTIIRPGELKLKLPSRHATPQMSEELTRKIKNLIDHELIIGIPSDNYNYFTWEIPLNNHDSATYVNLITDLRRLN
jgi:hypothetical protein